MAAAKTLDEKLYFEAYDCRPGFAAWHRFRTNLLLHGGTFTDDEGWSYADHYLGVDDGGPNGAMPIIPAGAGVANVAARSCGRACVQDGGPHEHGRGRDVAGLASD